jgi:outer membrane lipoprotein-sorting protein
MNTRLRIASAAALALPLLLSGCSLFPTTRKLPIPKPPLVTQTVSAEDLAASLNKRWDSLSTLTATVEIQASVMKSKEGLAKDYPTLHGHILMRKPNDLRVVAQYLGIRFFDMASDGKTFTVSIPPQSKVIEGSNAVTKKSANPLENLRPDFFLDAIVVRGMTPDDHYMVTADTVTVEDAARKHLYAVPEYKLSIMRPKGNGVELEPRRVVYFHRDDLQPYQQDIYDSDGNLVTQVTYAGYHDFDGSKYPSSVVITRPVEEIRIILSVDSVKENQPLPDNQFVVPIPDGAKIQKME